MDHMTDEAGPLEAEWRAQAPALSSAGAGNPHTEAQLEALVEGESETSPTLGQGWEGNLRLETRAAPSQECGIGWD